MSKLDVRGVVFAVVLAACGGSTASVPSVDAGAGVDAPAALTELGQACLVANNGSDCPTQTPGCLGFGGVMGICSSLCVSDGTMMTDAQGAIASISPDPTGAQAQTICNLVYTGATGVPTCAAVVLWNPMDMPPKASTMYTGVGVACVIGCDAQNACPSPLKCNTTVSRCEP